MVSANVSYGQTSDPAWANQIQRCVCTFATRPTPATGLEIYETDTKRTFVHDGTGWVCTGEPMNSWAGSAIVNQGITPAVARTVNVANYHRTDGWFTGAVRLAFTGTGTSGSIIKVQNPLAPFDTSSSITPVGQFYYYDASAATQYSGFVTLSDGGTMFSFVRGDITPANYFGADPAIPLGNGDGLNFTFSFQAQSRYS